MKFNFKIQQYQTDAVDSVVNCFKGQPYIDNVSYRRDISKDIQGNSRIGNIGCCSHFVNRQTGNTVYKDMVFVAPVEFELFFVGLVGHSMHTKFTVVICFWLMIRFKFI